jgi:GAF domain/ANTAR domain
VQIVAGSSFSAALDALERTSEAPEGFCRPFLDVLPISGASVSTIGDLLGSETLAASDDQAARLDELQFDLGEGPCWDALRTGNHVLAPSLREPVRARWPAFSAAIREEAVSSIFAFPLVIGPLRIGAIDLYSASPTTLDDRHTRQADAMAAVVSRHVLRRALNAVGRDEEEGGNAYSRRLIHQATGFVLAQLDLTPEDARLVIQGHAFAAERSMMEVAQDIVDGTIVFARQPDGIEASG